MAANELVNALKQPSPLFTTAASSDHLSELKKLATIIEAAASSRPVLNTPNIPQLTSVQPVPIHVPQPPIHKFSTHSTPVTTTPGPPDNYNITAPIKIPYNKSEIIPTNPPMFNHH